MVDEVYIKQYTDLLINQYSEKENAAGEIKATVSQFEKTFALFNEFLAAFDLDNATGNRLDIIGSWVEMPRTIPFELEKTFFGFDGQTNTKGFSNKFDPTVIGAPFRDRFAPGHTDLQLNDDDYRFFIKCRIAKNACHAFMITNNNNSIQDVIKFMFPSGAFVDDTQRMRLVLYVFGDFDAQKLNVLRDLDLLPRPQGVSYSITNLPDVPYFGFAGDDLAAGFSDKFDPTIIGGVFAKKVF